MLTYKLFIFLVAYLLGTIPSAFLAGKIKKIDVRKLGSGNIGATNAYRLLGKKWGIAVLAADAVKGGLAAYLGLIFFGTWGGLAGGILALLGHTFNPWFGFKPSGKGVASALGIVCVLMPKVMVVGVCVFVVTVAISRFVSLGSVLGALAVIITALVFREELPNIIFAIIGCSLIVIRHIGNLKRIANGTEPKFGQKHDSKDRK
ncbi:MAG: glycerol-3-phosphate 1-O-acyltransferase PlsY [Peptococcaceae bacterium]|nr:glycerol-3-phosphate 1-O-acyltransferase PlsY [Peptococcaceae bacterium]